MILNINEFYDLLNQVPPPVLLTGNLYSTQYPWGCTKLDHQGKMLEDILTKHNLCILNDISPTYLHPATGTTSAIDLSVCSPSIFLDLQWKTLDDLCGSDHYPITLYLGTTEISSILPSWKLRKADWVSFSDKTCEQLSSGNPYISVDECSEKLIAIATDTIPKSNFSRQKHNTVWFNDCPQCFDAVGWVAGRASSL